jgi:hypothetical protein
MRRAHYKKLFVALVMMAISGFCLQAALAMEKNIEDQYLNALRSANTKARIVVSKKITHSYIENQEIFAEVERQLRQGYSNCQNPDFLDLMSWYCKVLASSGNAKYQPALTQVARNSPCPKLSHYASASIKELPFQQERNRTLAKSAEWEKKGVDPHSARIAVLLKSDDFKLQRDGAKMLLRSIHPDLRLYDLVEKNLEKYITSDAFRSFNGGDKLVVDTMAWMCKALPASANHKYHDTLETIARDSQSEKLTRYAREALGR